MPPKRSSRKKAAPKKAARSVSFDRASVAESEPPTDEDDVSDRETQKKNQETKLET